MTTTTWEKTRDIEVIGLGLDDWTVEPAPWESEEERRRRDAARRWERYGTVWVRVGESEYEVSVAIGVPPSLRATAEAAGGDRITPYLDAWYVDSSDWSRAPSTTGPDGVPAELSYALLEAIRDARHRLWREYQQRLAREGAGA